MIYCYVQLVHDMVHCIISRLHLHIHGYGIGISLIYIRILTGVIRWGFILLFSEGVNWNVFLFTNKYNIMRFLYDTCEFVYIKPIIWLFISRLTILTRQLTFEWLAYKMLSTLVFVTSLIEKKTGEVPDQICGERLK